MPTSLDMSQSSIDKHLGDVDEKAQSVGSVAAAPAHDVSPHSLRRNISALGIIGLGMSICNGYAPSGVGAHTVADCRCSRWAAMSSTIVLGLSQGGTVVVLYGLIAIAIINVFLALNLGELASAYPTAGGQYVWSAILAKGQRTRRIVSFAVGWTTLFAWITTTASVVMILAEVVFAVVELYRPDFNLQRWQVYLVYLATNWLSIAYNIFCSSRAPFVGKAFFYFSTLVFLAILGTVVGKAPAYNSNKFVWATYTNETGWVKGAGGAFVTIMTGLVNPGCALQRRPSKLRTR